MSVMKRREVLFDRSEIRVIMRQLLDGTIIHTYDRIIVYALIRFDASRFEA